MTCTAPFLDHRHLITYRSSAPSTLLIQNTDSPATVSSSHHIPSFLRPTPSGVIDEMASTIPVSDVQANGSAESNGASDVKEYTLDSLKEHNSRDSLWMLLDGKVYDVTSFMDEVGFFSDHSYSV